jgi:DNA polymerase-1
LLAEHGDLEGVLAAAPTIKQNARREAILSHADAARLSRRLVALRDDVPLPRPIETLKDEGADEASVAAFFEPLGFRQVIRELGGTRRRAGEDGGSAPSAKQRTDDPGAIEIGREGELVLRGDAIALVESDVERLRELAAQWLQAPQLGLATLLDGDDAQTADLVGIAVAVAGAPTVYLPVGHRQSDLVAGRPIPTAAVVEALRAVLAKVPIVAHDHKALGHSLARFGLELGTIAADPMLESYTIDPARTDHSLAALAKDVLDCDVPAIEPLLGKGRGMLRPGDVDVAAATALVAARAEATLALADAMKGVLARAGAPVRKLLDDIEMPLAWVLRRIEPRGIAVDCDELRRQSEEITLDIARIQAKVDEQAGHPVHIDSPIQLQKLLFEERKLPATRKTKTGYTTDAKALEELALLDPIVADILEYRSLVKLKGTYLDTLPALVRPDTGRLHTSFHQAVAATGRLSSSDPNLQNIPIRTKQGKRIREAFVAPPGRLLVALDYSQIELRILAHLSADPNLASAFTDDVDVHRRTAAEVFAVSEVAVTDEQRRIAKAVNFGVVYGQTAFGLAQQLGIPRGKAGSYIRAYFEKVPGVDRYMKELIDVAKVRGFSETIFGRRRRIPELVMRAGASRSYGERIARNTPIQGSAADILKVAMIAVERELARTAGAGRPWAQMLLTVHDELIFETDEDRVDDLVALARPLMESAASLSVPLRVDAGHGRRWADCKG